MIPPKASHEDPCTSCCPVVAAGPAYEERDGKWAWKDGELLKVEMEGNILWEKEISGAEV